VKRHPNGIISSDKTYYYTPVAEVSILHSRREGDLPWGTAAINLRSYNKSCQEASIRIE
jgi:hypothetical protein